MFTDIKKWLQITLHLLILLLGYLSVFTQPKFLDAEIDINTGLTSNQVRVIEKCRDNSLWIGTDGGLVILNNKDSIYTPLINKIGNVSVFTIAFYHNTALIGTRFNGIYLFDLDLKKIIKYFDTSSVGLTRRFKIIHDTVFIATKSNPLYLTYKKSKWQLHKIPTDIKDGYITDFAFFENNVFGSVYSKTDYQLRILKKDKFILPDEREYWFNNAVNASSLSLSGSDSVLLIGGDGFVQEIKSGQKPKYTKLALPGNFQPLPVWDIINIEKRIFFSIGDPNTLKKGMIYSPNSTIKEINPNFYGQCLSYDDQKDALWIGTMNRGLFYWPYISSSFNVSNLLKGELKFIAINPDSLLIHDERNVILFDLINSHQRQVYQRNISDYRSKITDLYFRNDTLIILDPPRIAILNLKTKTKKYITLPDPMNFDKFTKLFLKDEYIYSFAIYGDGISKTNIKSGKSEILPVYSTQPQFVPYFKNIIYHSPPNGFIYFNGNAKPFDINVPFSESFTVKNDTLYTLYSGKLKIYQLDTISMNGKLLFEEDLKNLLPGFNPTGLFNVADKIFITDKKGMILWNAKKNIPKSYLYIGNYKDGKIPLLFDHYLFYNHTNYITRVNPESSPKKIKKQEWKTVFNPGNRLYQGSPLDITFESQDFILENHSLKRIDIYDQENLIHQSYSISSRIQLPSNLNKGNYIIRSYVNDYLIHTDELKIIIPITSNPLFYISVSLFFLIFIIFIANYIIDKKAHERQILLNRLQLLKQNLNPHFIFNSLNLIYSLVLQNKNQSAVETITYFSDLHRYYLENINKVKISLSEELIFIESFLKIESARVQLDDAFIYSIPNDLSKYELNFLVPPMILQPLVENAVKYSSIEKGIRHIWIDLRIENKNLIIGIENTLNKSEARFKPGNKLGLQIVQERIDIHNKSYQEKIEFSNHIPCNYTNEGYRCELIFYK